jgi:hypothetical protein
VRHFFLLFARNEKMIRIASALVIGAENASLHGVAGLPVAPCSKILN